MATEDIASQTETTYEQAKKLKSLVDLGYFLEDYIVTGGVVTKDVTYNNIVNVTEIVVSLDNDVTRREATSFKTKVANTTYYLDYMSSGDFSWDTAHYSGSYLPVARVTTDANKNVLTITDMRGTIGGFRLKSTQPLVGYLKSVNVYDFGARGNGTDETVSIQAAIDAALAIGSKSIIFSPGDYIATSLTNLNSVTLAGDNATLTVGGESYKVNSFAKPNQSQILYSRAIEEIANFPVNSLLQAQRAVHNRTLRVVYWGDSNTESGDQTKLEDGYAYRLDAEIRKSLPNVTVVSANYGLGGRTAAKSVDPAFVGIAGPEPFPPPENGFYRPWSTIGKSWLDTVKDFKPDLIIYAFGMNDASTAGSDDFEAFNLYAVVAAVATWDVVPSLVLVPTFLPTKDHTRYFQGQNITKSVARATREFGKINGIAVADANRLFQILRDGVEDVARAGSSESNFDGYGTSLWAGDKANYTLNAGVLTPTSTASNKFVTRNRMFYNGVIQFDFMPVNSTDAAWVNYRLDPTGLLGNLIVLVQPALGVIGLYSSTDGGTPIASVSGLSMPINTFSNLKIEADGVSHKIYLNGTLVITTTTFKKLNDGYVGFGSNASSVVYANLNIIYEDSLSAEAPYTEDELLGRYNQAGESGNGINHPTGQGHALFYMPAFNGLIRGLSELNLSYDVNVTNKKENIAAGATVDLFNLSFATGQYVSVFVEISSFGLMQGAGTRIATTTFHLDWASGGGTWTQISNSATGTSGNQLSHATTDGAFPKIACATIGTVGGSYLRSNIRIIGDQYAVYPV